MRVPRVLELVSAALLAAYTVFSHNLGLRYMIPALPFMHLLRITLTLLGLIIGFTFYRTKNLIPGVIAHGVVHTYRIGSFRRRTASRGRSATLTGSPSVSTDASLKAGSPCWRSPRI